MCSLICESVRWCVFVVHMSKCVCLHKSVGLDVDVRVHVCVQIHVGGCIIAL